MRKRSHNLFESRAMLSAAVVAMACASAQAKVVFTGYGDMQFTPQSQLTVSGPQALLNSFGLGPGNIESRNFNLNAVGLFASSVLSDNAKVLIDLTFRNIGATTKTTDIQYGYLEYDEYGGQAEAGKITLPFNWYNQNRFYPFQRPSIDGPFFQSAILGLPISDIGATAGRTFMLDDKAALRIDAYAVNGFQSVGGSSDTFRAATIPGALAISNNITGTSSNHRLAIGGRIEGGPTDLDQDSVGVSYYRTQWSADGQGLFQMIGAHIHAMFAGFDFLTEYLQLDVTHDRGMTANFGSENWRTDGVFGELDYKHFSAWGKPITPWVRAEDYRSYGANGGRENATDYAGGLSVQVLDTLAVKFQASRIYYRLPFVNLGDIALRGYVLQSGLTVTF